jgi:hypothetical protein
MTTLRFPHRRGATATVAGLLAAAAIILASGPAAADPSPAPSQSAPASPGANAPQAAPGTISWAAQPSSAQGPDGRRIFSYDKVKAGTVVHDYVAVTNYSAMPVTFKVYATDAFNNASGQLDMLPAAQKPKDVGAWVSVNKNTLNLQPKESINEALTLTVPASATPGDHAGGIIVSVTVEGKDKSGGLVKVDRRLAVPLNLRVDGALQAGIKIESVSSAYHGSANPVQGGGVDVNYTIHNTGNIRLNLTQDISAKGLFGLARLRSTAANPLTDLLPDATYQTKVHLANVFPLGPMNVRVHAVPSQPAGMPPIPVKPAAQSFSVSMWATPWLLVLLIVVLVGGFFLVRWLLRMRRARREAMVADAMAAASRQTVEQLRKKASAAKAKVGSGADRGPGDK